MEEVIALPRITHLTERVVGCVFHKVVACLHAVAPHQTSILVLSDVAMEDINTIIVVGLHVNDLVIGGLLTLAKGSVTELTDANGGGRGIGLNDLEVVDVLVVRMRVLQEDLIKRIKAQRLRPVRVLPPRKRAAIDAQIRRDEEALLLECNSGSLEGHLE